MLRRLLLGLAVAGMALAAPVMTAKADTTLSFGSGSLVTSAGVNSISYAGGATDLVGTNLALSSVGSVGDLTATGTLNHATVSFSTGTYSSFAGGIYTFAGGGAITITGGGTFGANTVPVGSTLLSGVFNGPVNVINTGSGFKFFGAGTIVALNPTVASYFGFGPPNSYPGNISFNFRTATNNAAGGAFASRSISSGSVQAINPVPEPATVAAVLSGLPILAFSLLRFRRKRA